MFFNLRFTACCLVLLGTSLTWAQNVRVVVNFRGDVTITGTRNLDDLDIGSTPNGEIYLVGYGATAFDFAGDTYEANTAFTLPGTSSSSIIRLNLSDGDDVVYFFTGAKSVTANLGRGRDFIQVAESLVENDIIVDAGADDDVVEIGGVFVGRNLRVNLGAGETDNGDDADARIGIEEVVITDCEIYGSLNVNQTSGGSVCEIDGCFVDSTSRVTLGTGNDQFLSGADEDGEFGQLYVNLGPGIENEESAFSQVASLSNGDVYGALTMIGGATSDFISVDATFVDGNVSINGGPGSGRDDCLARGFFTGNVNITSGSGRDSCSAEGNILGNVSINSGPDADDVALVAAVGGNVNLNSSLGDDLIHIAFSRADEPGNWYINAGSGDDELRFTLPEPLETRTFSAILGAGDDVVFDTRNLEITTQIGDPRMNGGTGTDTFDALAPSVNATGFEVFPLDVL